MPSLRIDPEQHFSCSQCGRCCRRADVIVTAAEIDFYRRRGADQWSLDPGADAFEPMPSMPALHRIRKRGDGACVFLSAENRCRIHQELGAANKPLTCRVYPYAFHRAPEGVVVTPSFGCPTIAANEGAPVSSSESLKTIESLSKEWLDAYPAPTRSRQFVSGRSIDARTMRILRDNLLVMLKRDGDDIRANVARIAHALDDLTRRRVLSLGEQEFAEYVALTLPYASSQSTPPGVRTPGAIGRLLQRGFLYVVCATREAIERRHRSTTALRMARLTMLAHFHGIGPAAGRVNLRALKRRPVDINAPPLRPIVFHYLRSTLETLGARDRAILDDLAIAVSYLNAACALASMNADALGQDVDRAIFIDALTEASDLSHTTDTGVLGSVLKRFAAGTEALWKLAGES